MTSGPFSRIAVVNRGETAVRLIRAVRELQREGRDDLRAIALATEPDRSALFVREADEVAHLGSPTFVDPRDGQRKNRYLDYAAIERALRETRAEAVWVGWGFVSEHAEFAELCRRLGVVFIGPDPEVMRALGDKIGSKQLAEKAGVPVAPWSGGPVRSLEDARHQAGILGFPLMIKATAGGGGRGIRRVRDAGGVAEAFESARSEALKGFGDDTVFMERLVEGARHVEVQIIGDGATTWALGVRDCTIQRRNQKVVEESPSPALTTEQQRELCEAAARLGQTAGYRNAGTVEFLYDPADETFSFMEVNARLQVEHPVTEETTGVDLVKLQLHVASGGRLEGPPPSQTGHAIEVRVNAEDPERGFAPAPGRLELFRLPGGPGLRVDSGFAEGDRIAPEFDSMLAKVIARGRTRDEALARLRRALEEMRLAVRGGSSNKGFLLALLQRPEVVTGAVDVGWLDRLAAADAHLPREHAEAALVQAAIDAYDAEFAVEKAQFYAAAARGRPRVRAEVGRDVELRHRGQRYLLRVQRLARDRYAVTLDGQRLLAERVRVGEVETRLRVGGRELRVVSFSNGSDQLVEVNGIPHRLSRDDAGLVRSPSPAVVVSIDVREGDTVAAGDRIAVLEAMKTELPVLAPFSGRVRSVVAAPNTQVDTGAPLVAIEASADAPVRAATERIRLPDAAAEAAESDPRALCRRLSDELRCLVLGYDIDPADTRRLLARRTELCGRLAPDDAQLLADEDAILAAFADAGAVFRRRDAPASDEDAPDASAEEYLYVYLRALETAGAGLPAGFLERLRRAVAHYGVETLERSPDLEEGLVWLCKAHARMADLVRVVVDILERRLGAVEQLAPHFGDEARTLFDRIVTTARGRHQGVADLARELRYRCFDRPFFSRIREEIYGRADAALAALPRSGGAERAEHVAWLVDCPQPLVTRLLARYRDADPAFRAVALEILLRRYYRIRSLEALESVEADGLAVAHAHYHHHGDPIHVFLTAVPWEELGSCLSTLGHLVRELPNGDDVMLDLFTWRETGHPQPDEVAAALHKALERAHFSRPLRRVVVASAVRGAGSGMASMQHFTFRPSERDYREERPYRGLHPMMGKRLSLWQTGNFEIERLPSIEDVYLFQGVARSNPRDTRLFAFAEVRDLTPVRDESGRIVRLPHLELMLMEALAAIRTAQSKRGPRERLYWNRVVLHLWPTLDLSPADLNEIAYRLAPATDGLGLECVQLQARMPDPATGALRERVVEVANPGGHEVELRFREPEEGLIEPLDEYERKVVRMRQRGLVHPFELIRMLTPPRDGTRTEFPPGVFTEYDLDEANRLVPVERPPGHNTANVVVGRIRNFTAKHPEGMERVLLMGDPSREMGSLAEPECRRVLAALDLAEQLGVPLDWFALSAGAKIAMDSGTENLDWTARVIRRLVEFTQAGGIVNVVVSGVNVGAQSYWNAEATMLMHTRGILIMTPESSMVLTGKRALDYSGGVSAEDNEGIGGYDRIMGRNGQGQYWAADIGEACRLLLRTYEHTYVAPGERFPRRAATRDPGDRDVSSFPHGRVDGTSFDTVGEIFSDEKNPGRKKPFDIRRVMRAVIDQDHEPVERWRDMREAENAVVWDAHLGGHPVCAIGFESRAIQRLGFVPIDGPDQWTPGTLFPLSSKKVARALNSASGNRPVVLISNLSGFDGSPESMRRLQLEYGAEIGRAVVNFRGPIVFCVVSRYHGGAYVVFSRTLNENVHVAALEGSYASVIGGAPAAAVVFTAEVDRRTRADARLQDLEQRIGAADEAERGHLRARWHELFETVRTEKLGEVAEHFEQIHSVERARQVGSLDGVLPPVRLRPYLIGALEQGIARELERWRAAYEEP